MHKIWALSVALVLILSGCNIQKIPAEVPPATTEPTPTIPPRKDLSGNIITTLYAEGVFVKTENGMLYMTENETEKQFRLSARAEKNISALGISEGTKIIVNYDGVGEGEVAEAISVEKIL